MLESDKSNDLQKRRGLQQLKENAIEQENVRRAREMKVPRKPKAHEPHVQVSVRHVNLDVQTRKFPRTCEVSAMYNWIGSVSPDPEHFILSICGMPVLDPSLPITVADRTLVHMAEYNETSSPASIMNCPKMSEIQATENTHYEGRTMNNIPLVTDIIPACLLEDDL